jgi:hypothetical protein
MLFRFARGGAAEKAALSRRSLRLYDARRGDTHEQFARSPPTRQRQVACDCTHELIRPPEHHGQRGAQAEQERAKIVQEPLVGGAARIGPRLHVAVDLLAVVAASLHRSAALGIVWQAWTPAVDDDPARGAHRPLGAAVGGRGAKVPQDVTLMWATIPTDS